jgi:hypothetical protein
LLSIRPNISAKKGESTVVNIQKLEQDIANFFSRGGKITQVPRGVMKHAPDVTGSWQDISQRHKFTLSNSRASYMPITTEDGEPIA